MPKQGLFRPIEDIVNDDLLWGDLMFLQKRTINSQGTREVIFPVFYLGPGEYVGDGSSGIEKGEHFEGVRVANCLRDGELRWEGLGNRCTVFEDREKGMLVRFNDNPAREYSPDTPFDRLETHQYAFTARGDTLF